jgi:ectoine hydroxylase-related dioxygenase (phytanoyl-CoA dioxygenase family)
VGQASPSDLFRETGYYIADRVVRDAVCNDIVQFALSLPNAIDGTFKPIPMAHRTAEPFLDFIRLPAIVEFVELFVGGRASGIGSEYFYMRPGTRGFTAHQDNFYIQAPGDSFVSAWTAFCDVGPENGGPTFYPGSHRLGRLPTRSGEMLQDPGQNPGARAVETMLPSEYQGIDLRMKKGSTVFFHGELVHFSNDNRSNGFRHAFLGTYIRKGAPFRAGTYQKRTEVDLHVG